MKCERKGGKQKPVLYFLTSLPLLVVLTSAAAQQNYPSRPVRLVVPFAEGGAPGLVSRRPARGEGVQAAGFLPVALNATETYPVRPIRLIVPFAEGGTPGLVSRRPARGQGVQAAGFYAGSA